MNTIKKLMFCTDFSDTSQAAKELALWLRDTVDCELHVAHVYDPRALEMPAPYYFMANAGEWLDKRLTDLRDNGKKALDDLADDMKPCEAHFIEGRPGMALCDFANQHDIDMIVIGTHGHSGWDRFIMGSVAEYVVRHATCPVLTVKPKQAKADSN